MRIRPFLVSLLAAPVVLTGLIAPSAAAPGGLVSKRPVEALRPPWVPGEVLVAFRDGVSAQRSRRIHDRVGARAVDRIAGPGRLEVARVPDGRSIVEAIAAYERDPDVEAAEPNLYRYPASVPSDPEFRHLWALRNEGQSHEVTPPAAAEAAGSIGSDIDAMGAWEIETGSPQTVIAIIDSGVDVSHPDLVANLWVNPGESGGGKEINNIDDDGNGCVDDVHGCDFTRATPRGRPLHSDDPHGTHVAGTAAAVTNNGIGIAGVCGGDGTAPGCGIMPVRFLGSRGGTLEDELEAIAYVRQMQLDHPDRRFIINASYGGLHWSRLEREAFRRAGQAGILSVIAAGNSSVDNDRPWCGERCSPSYPASYRLPSTISVAATNHRDQPGYRTACAADPANTRNRCAFTSWGRRSVHVAAPGVDIKSTVPGAGYDLLDGTSMAAPHVAGIAGLVRSHRPDLGPTEVRNVIMNSVDADGVPAASGMFSVLWPRSNQPKAGRFTWAAGRVNAARALAEMDTSPAVQPHDGDIPGAKPLGRAASGQVSWPSDVNDLFAKRLMKGKRYRAVLRVPDGRDHDLFVWDPLTVEVWQGFWRIGNPRMLASSENLTKGADERVTFRARATGTHYFHVSAWYLSKGPYELRVRCLDC